MKKKHVIGIAGTHGKTTTSALVSYLLEKLQCDPTCFVGGTMRNYGTNILFGKSDLVVAEMDESDKSLLNYNPYICVLTNLEEDHMDTYRDLGDLKETMRRFLSGVHADGFVVYNYDDGNIVSVLSSCSAKYISFGLSDGAHLQARDIRYEGDRTLFSLYIGGVFVESLVIPMLGNHNVSNVLAALAVLYCMDIDISKAREVLTWFSGTKRRLEVLYKDLAYMIIDDYAHHPTEVAASVNVLRNLKEVHNELIVIFQPHRYSRTQHLQQEFGESFDGVSRVIITDIYGAGEEPIEGVDAQSVVDAVQRVGNVDVTYVPFLNLKQYIADTIPKKAIVAFLGAGNITEIAYEFTDLFTNLCARV